ncbi:hypothetical protein [Roseateles depolymerans]|uniref:Uncharacterized protein n=1 Tax=Roseateles depolymerans TaxID=76731 RepID=A0A0U3NE16_9BURK|nr:hypothetical protein [Roseateles depolymerans]ALV06688.1 hypothetical protein RD2015_2216 [Roseateles depolymerans]REG19665.1 hypothetical protein DES44_2165 [Roseateles depolymerans]
MRTPNEPTDNFKLPPVAPKPAPQPQPEVWKPTGTPGIQQDQNGRLRTDLPDPYKGITI